MGLIETYAECEYQTDKGWCHSYIEYYDELFGHLQHEPITFVEIGMEFGQSALLWSDFFTEADILMLDLVPHCPPELRSRLIARENLTIMDDNMNAAKFEIFGMIQGWLGKDRKIDILIDDGSHLVDHQAFTIEHWIDWVNPGGLIVIEDIQDSYPYGGPHVRPRLTQACQNRSDRIESWEFVDRSKIEARPGANYGDFNGGRYDDILLVVKVK